MQTTARQRPTYRVEILPRQYSVVVFDENAPVNYIASCQVFVYGDVGMMYTINGKRFYDALADKVTVQNLMRDLSVKTLEGYVTPAHARLMKFALRRAATVEEAHTGQMAGHEMIWVRVRCLA